MDKGIDKELILRVKNMIVRAVKLKISPESIDSDKPLFGDGLGLDSIDALELVIALEKEFGIRIPDAAVGKKVLASVRTMAEYIEETSNGKPS